jgi:uncharacterized protein (TIGR03435 family)
LNWYVSVSEPKLQVYIGEDVAFCVSGERPSFEGQVMKQKLSISLTLVFLSYIPLLHAQQKTPRLTFEVASIKLSKPGTFGGAIKVMPGGQEYVAQNASIKLIFSLMYKVPMRQITGGPDWFTSDAYDIDAKADHSYNLDDLHIMFQNLLADEFKLTFHKEIKEGNVYALTIDKSGLKMKENDTDQKFDIPITRDQSGVATGVRVPMQYLCWWLGQNLQQDERPVVDMTGLTKNYDFTLTFLPPLPPNFNTENLPPELLSRPSIFEALKQQLGLRLDLQKGPVEYYVIGHLERPAGN